MGVPCGVSDDRCHRCRFHTQGRQARSASDVSQRLLHLPTWRRTRPWMEEMMGCVCGVGEAVHVIYIFGLPFSLEQLRSASPNPQQRRRPRTRCWRCRQLLPWAWTPNPNVTRLCHVCVVTHSAWETAEASVGIGCIFVRSSRSILGKDGYVRTKKR